MFLRESVIRECKIMCCCNERFYRNAAMNCITWCALKFSSLSASGAHQMLILADFGPRA